MSSHSNANSASMPLYNNVNPGANPPQSVQLPYSYQLYHASASVPADYQQSNLVPLYAQHPDEQLHSLSSSMPTSITRYSQSGVNVSSTGAMQMGPSDMNTFDAPITVPHMPYTHSSYAPPNAMLPLGANVETDSRCGANNAAGDVNMDRENNGSSLEFLTQGDASLAVNSQPDSLRPNNLIFSTITKSNSGALRAFPESSQRTLLGSSSYIQSNHNEHYDAIHRARNYSSSRAADSTFERYDVSSPQLSPSRMWIDNDRNLPPQDSAGFGSRTTLAPGRTLTPQAGTHFEMSSESYFANDSSQVATLSYNSAQLYEHGQGSDMYPTNNESNYAHNILSEVSTHSDTSSNTSGISSAYLVHGRFYSDSGQAGQEAAVRTSSAAWPTQEISYTHPTTASPLLNRSSRRSRLVGQIDGSQGNALSYLETSPSAARNSRPINMYRYNSERVIQRSPNMLDMHMSVRSNSLPTPENLEGVPMEMRLSRNQGSFPHALSTSLQAPDDRISSISTGTISQPLLTPPFLVGSSVVPSINETELGRGYIASVSGIDTPIRAEPAQSNAAGRTPVLSVKPSRGRKRGIDSGELTSQALVEGSTAIDHGQANFSQKIDRSPQSPVFSRLSASETPQLASPHADTPSHQTNFQNFATPAATQNDQFLFAANDGWQNTKLQVRGASTSSELNEDDITSTGYLADISQDNSSPEIGHKGWQSEVSSSYGYHGSQAIPTSGSEISAIDRADDFSSLSNGRTTRTVSTSASIQNTASSGIISPSQNLEEVDSVSLPNATQTESADPPNEMGDPSVNGESEQQPPPKKVKMHQCLVCKKFFPRPSGLATHMNSHSGARPYKCPLPHCSKSFAVRSNARRHMRTHGIGTAPLTPSGNSSGGRRRTGTRRQPIVSESNSDGSDGEMDVVVEEARPRVYEFEPPVVHLGAGWPLDLWLGSKEDEDTDIDEAEDLDDSEAYGGPSNSTLPSVSSHIRSGNSAGKLQTKKKGKGKRAPKLKWVPQSLQSRSNAAQLRSVSPVSDMWDVDDDGSSDFDGKGKDTVMYSLESTTSSRRATSATGSSLHSSVQSPTGMMSSMVRNNANSSSGSRSAGPSSLRSGKGTQQPRVAPVPLPPVTPSPPQVSANPNAKFEERDSYAEAGTYPYHPAQFRALPGPAPPILVPGLRG